MRQDNFLIFKLFNFYSLLAVLLLTSSAAFAQDDLDEESTATGFKAPKRTMVVDNNPTMSIHGVVVDDATGQPVAGVRLKTLSDDRYAAMTGADGKFTIKLPVFATSLYVQAPKYLSQQVAIIAGDTTQQVRVRLLSDAFAAMYDDATTITATNSFVSNGNGLTIDEEMTARLGGDIRMNMHSGSLEQGAAMFVRGISSINANAQPLVILDGVELDMQRATFSICCPPSRQRTLTRSLS